MAFVRELARASIQQNHPRLTWAEVEALLDKTEERYNEEEQRRSYTGRAKATSYDAWLRRNFRSWDWDSPIYRVLVDTCQRVINGELTQVIINVPPRVGKSSTVTERLPAYWVSQRPQDGVIVGAYSKDLATFFTGAALRNYSIENARLVDSEREEEWNNIYGGFVKGVGAGSGVTGRGCELLLVDDPVKNYAEANSPSYQKMIWNWWLNDIRTRRNNLDKTPTILIMCMTGDTPVLMADGTETSLRDIKPGDEIATYENGRLSTSKVLNHKSNGPDTIYEVRTICGEIVRANRRHPFLVWEHGQLKWIRLENLTTDHTIVVRRGKRASGRGLSAWSKGVMSLFPAAATAESTTAKRCGATGIDRHRTTLSIGATFDSGPDTVSLRRLRQNV